MARSKLIEEGRALIQRERQVRRGSEASSITNNTISKPGKKYQALSENESDEKVGN